MMHRIFLCCVLIVSSPSLKAQERYLTPEYSFEIGSTEHLFGNKVVLREAPDAGSAALDTLLINEAIIIQEKTDQQYGSGDQRATWYRVHIDGRSGYILDRFISMDRVVFSGDTYLVQYRQNESNSPGTIKYRLVLPDHRYLEGNVPSRTYSFGIAGDDGHGLSNVQSMLVVLHYAEACGVNGGATVIFHANGVLQEIADLSEVSDAGVFWFNEKLDFPDHTSPSPQSIVYTRETGEYLDDELEWEEVHIVRRTLHWQGDRFEPGVKEVQDAE